MWSIDTVEAPPRAVCTLTVDVAGSGTVTADRDQVTYTSGMEITLTAMPPVGWAFSSRSGGDGTHNADGTYALTMDAAKTVIANFALAHHATGFYEPIVALNSFTVRAPGTRPTPVSSTIWNTAKGGSAIPRRFDLYECDGGPEMTDTTGISFSRATVACPSCSQDDEAVDFTTSGSTSLHYDATKGLLIRNGRHRG